MTQTEPTIRMDTDVLAELAALSLTDDTMDSALQKIVSVARRRVPGASAASTTLLVDGKPRTAAFDGQVAVDLDERQYTHGFGPCIDAGTGGETLLIRDMRTEDRWPDYTPGAVETGVLSSLSVPFPINDSIVGALNLYSTGADAFDESSLVAAESVASFAAMVIRSFHAYDNVRREAESLQRAMQSRAVIEQAKGVLIAQHAIPADEAFARMVKLSQQSNVKLRDVAAAIVYQAAAGRVQQ